MGWKIGVIAIIILVIIAYFGVAAYIAHILSVPNPSPVVFDETQIAERVVDVNFKSKDGLPLSGWYFPGTNDKAIMFVHGAGNQNRVNEIYGTPDIAKFFVGQGYSVLMFDLRGSGESAQTRLGLGGHEANDVIGAYEYLKTQDFESHNIGIISNSLGAIAIIMASDSLKDAGAIVLDSPASEVKPVVSFIMQDEHNVPSFVHPAVFLWAKTLYEIDIDAIRPVDRIGSLSDTPLLYLHGENDTLIPPINTEVLHSKAGGDRIVFPDTGHILTYQSNKEQYLSVVSEFFSKNLGH